MRAGSSACFGASKPRVRLEGIVAGARKIRKKFSGWIGSTIRGKYRVHAVIGEGGWGTVFEAEHLMLRRRVAIKVLHERLAEEPRRVERFRREALASSRIGHPNIVEVLDLDTTDDGDHFMVLELLRGHDLASLLDTQGMMSVPRALHIFAQVADGLAAAHAAGIVHRDLKPDNIFLLDKPGARDFPKIVDFGISKLVSIADATGTLTNTGTLLGTPHYMPPEQARGEKTLDHRADLYALGVMLYETLTGVLPFDGDNLPAIVMALMQDNPAPIACFRDDVPDALNALVVQLMSKEPDARPQSAEDVAEELRLLAALSVDDAALDGDASEDDATIISGGFSDVDFSVRPSSQESVVTTEVTDLRVAEPSTLDMDLAVTAQTSLARSIVPDDDESTLVMESPVFPDERQSNAAVARYSAPSSSATTISGTWGRAGLESGAREVLRSEPGLDEDEDDAPTVVVDGALAETMLGDRPKGVRSASPQVSRPAAVDQGVDPERTLPMAAMPPVKRPGPARVKKAYVAAAAAVAVVSVLLAWLAVA